MNRIVDTAYGKIEGVRSAIQKYTVFKGIPYAKPPIGERRWRAPEKCEKWQGVRRCAEFAPAAMQPEHPVGSFYEVEFYQGGVDMSEDCLYLNVWADLAKKNQPVMLWIHGGAYRHGFSHEMEFDGDAFARRGVILVTVNYRVGVLGFMAHPELTARDGHSGNYGLMDQIAALEWVRENISGFGGDPDNITIFGQSAGGGSVQAIMTSPLAKGMFKRAIIQSAGSPLTSLGGRNDVAKAEKLGAALGDISNLYKEDAAAITLRGLEVANEIHAGFAPCVDGYVLPDYPGDVFIRGEAMDESLMLGSVTGDAGLFCGSKENPDEMAITATVAMGKARVKLGKTGCYIYHFNRDIPGDDHPGAFHSSELWYVFGTLARSNRPFTGADYDLSQKMTDWWTNFARTGDPMGGWTAFTDGNMNVNVITDGADMKGMDELTLADQLSNEILGGIYA